jgi:hypothetical protein
VHFVISDDSQAEQVGKQFLVIESCFHRKTPAGKGRHDEPERYLLELQLVHFVPTFEVVSHVLQS